MRYDIVEWDYGTAADGNPLQAALDGRSIDLAIADPPYNIGVEYEDDDTKDRMEPTRYRNLMRRCMRCLERQSRPGATLWWVCPVNDICWVREMLQDNFGPERYLIVWHETFSQYNRHDLTRDFRFVVCSQKPGLVAMNLDAIRIPSRRMEMGDKRAAGPRIPGCVWQFRRLQGTAKARVPWHKAQLPPELLDRIILGWSSPGDLVVDAFAGSGSAGLRCLEHERDFVGVDRSPTYCRKMRERIDAARGWIHAAEPVEDDAAARRGGAREVPPTD